jgi:hypothetical protein
MKNWSKIFPMLLFAAIVVPVCVSNASAATKHYVITNDDVAGPNTATVAELDSATGSLKVVKVLNTNGFGAGGGYFGLSRGAASTANCLFISNAGTTIGGQQVGDIAAFTAPGFVLVGNYSNPSLSGLANGIGLVVNPNNQYLYAAYTTASNIGVWQIGSDCSLTLASTTASGGAIGGMALAQQAGGGQYLAVSYPKYPNKSYVDLFIISNGGSTVTEEASGPQIAFSMPIGVDIPKDGNVAVFGDTSNPEEIETWWISTTPGTCFPTTAAPPCLSAHQNFSKLSTGDNSSNLWLSPAAWSNPTTGGCLYVSSNTSIKVATAKFVEGTTPGTVSITPTSRTPYTIAQGAGTNYTVAIQTVTDTGTGGGIYVVEWPNYIATVDVNTDCSLGASKAIPDPSPAAALLSITAWPPR